MSACLHRPHHSDLPPLRQPPPTSTNVHPSPRDILLVQPCASLLARDRFLACLWPLWERSWTPVLELSRVSLVPFKTPRRARGHAQDNSNGGPRGEGKRERRLHFPAWCRAHLGAFLGISWSLIKPSLCSQDAKEGPRRGPRRPQWVIKKGGERRLRFPLGSGLSRSVLAPLPSWSPLGPCLPRRARGPKQRLKRAQIGSLEEWGYAARFPAR
eukprot:7845501-Pyramimonas_sp.AAC.1